VSDALAESSICAECVVAGFKHRRLELYYCPHRQALRYFDGRDWHVVKPCTRGEAHCICSNISLKLWDVLSDASGASSNVARQRLSDQLDRLNEFLEGLRETT